MNVMVIGKGGREHALIKSLKKSKNVEKLYALPGNAGIALDALCVDIAVEDIDGVVSFAKNNAINYAVVAPDDPLVAGMVDALTAAGIPCFGPDAKAAAIEGSKVFSKNLMKKYGIPTAGYEVFNDPEKAKEYIKGNNSYPTVIKADGLALGKGVVIAESFETAAAAIDSIMVGKQFGKSGDSIVVEEFLEGPEVSALCFCDGKTVKPMASSMDHKRALDGDKGLNTGGMGTIAPNPFFTDDVASVCMDKIFLPTVRAMQSESRPFRGCLYFGLMLTKNGPKVIEYNCRFGDPETQVVIPLLESDLLEVMMATTNGTLDKCEVRIKNGAACCVMLASGGYPEKYQSGFPIDFGGADEMPGVEIYHSGTKQKDDKIVTAGGRVLGVSATAENLEKAVAKAYDAASRIRFENSHMRLDIGKRALSKE